MKKATDEKINKYFEQGEELKKEVISDMLEGFKTKNIIEYEFNTSQKLNLSKFYHNDNENLLDCDFVKSLVVEDDSIIAVCESGSYNLTNDLNFEEVLAIALMIEN